MERGESKSEKGKGMREDERKEGRVERMEEGKEGKWGVTYLCEIWLQIDSYHLTKQPYKEKTLF